MLSYVSSPNDKDLLKREKDVINIHLFSNVNDHLSLQPTLITLLIKIQTVKVISHSKKSQECGNGMQLEMYVDVMNR